MAEQDDDERRYDSLDEAFREQRTTLANQVFLRRLFSGIDVEAYFARGGYLKVTRTSGDPALQVHHGWTNGFRSREEILAAVEGAPAWRSARMQNTWGVTHPDHGPFRGSSDRKPRGRVGGPCPECGDVLALSGVCNNPDCPLFGIVP